MVVNQNFLNSLKKPAVFLLKKASLIVLIFVCIWLYSKVQQALLTDYKIKCKVFKVHLVSNGAIPEFLRTIDERRKLIEAAERKLHNIGNKVSFSELRDFLSQSGFAVSEIGQKIEKVSQDKTAFLSVNDDELNLRVLLQCKIHHTEKDKIVVDLKGTLDDNGYLSRTNLVRLVKSKEVFYVLESLTTLESLTYFEKKKKINRVLVFFSVEKI